MLTKYFLVLPLLFFVFSIKSHKNNVCNTYKSYPTLSTFIPFKSKECFYNPLVFANSGTIIELLGYKTKNYTIITDDGYILNLMRMIPKTGPKKGAQPVFFQHGILLDSTSFLFAGNRSLAFVLAENGYDIWLGNSRCTMYARKHLNMTDSDYKFWNFNLDDLAANDIKTSLSKVAEITGQKGNIIFIGHSMGGTLAFMYESRFASNNLLKGIITLGPVVFWDQSTPTTKTLHLVPFTGKVLNFFGINSLFTNRNLVLKPVFHICVLVPKMCLYFMLNIFIGQSDLFKPRNLTPYFMHWLDALSLEMIVQYGQMAISDKFEMYNYGEQKNLEKYGQKNPPEYKFENIKIPVYNFYGARDFVVTTSNMKRINNVLGTDKSEKDYQIVPIGNKNPKEEFGHIEFIIGEKVETLFYPDLLRYLKKLAPLN